MTIEQRVKHEESEYDKWERERLEKLEKEVGEEVASKVKEIRSEDLDRFYSSVKKQDTEYTDRRRKEKLKELITYEYGGKIIGLYLKSVTEKKQDGEVLEKAIIGMLVPDKRYPVEMRRFLGAFGGDLKYSTDLLEGLDKITKIEYKQRVRTKFKVPMSMRGEDYKIIEETPVKPTDISCFVTAIDKEGKAKTYEFQRWEIASYDDESTQQGIMYEAK